MSNNNRSVAHELFYLKDSSREEIHGSNMYVCRGKDCTVAYSYSTPIAVFPDKGGFVLMDGHSFSATTAKHQSYLRGAVPANVLCIVCDWQGENDTWRHAWHYPFQERLGHFLDRLERKVAQLVINPDDYILACTRRRETERLEALRVLFTEMGRKRAAYNVARKQARLNNPERIRKGRKRRAVMQAGVRKVKERHRREQSLSCKLTQHLKTHPEDREYLMRYADTLVARYPAVYLQRFRQQCRRVGSRVMDPSVLDAVAAKLAKCLDESWDRLNPARSLGCICDLELLDEAKGRFVTTKGVSISHRELQRCLHLWKAGKLVGDRVEDRYSVVDSTPDELVIGCHWFPQCVVHRIFERYAGKDMATIADEERQMKAGYAGDVSKSLLSSARYLMNALEQAQADSASHGMDDTADSTFVA